MAEQSVRQIVEQCQQGDREAFGLLYTTMSDRLRQVCRHYVADENTVNDLLHDSFILIFSKIKTLKDPSKAEAWMQKVTQNLSLMYLQQHKQGCAIPIDELKEPLDVDAPSVLPITYDEIMNLVDALPNSLGRVFRLSVLEGLSHQEISALLNIDPHTSSAQLFRAKKILRHSLAVFLLGLLCVSLPLGWHWISQQKTTSESKPVASATKNDTSQSQESSVSPFSPSRTDSSSVPCELFVRLVQTNSGTRLLSDTLPLLTAEIVEPDTVKTQEEQRQQPTPLPKPEERIVKDNVIEISVKATSNHKEWTMQLAYSGFNRAQTINLPYGEPGWNDPEMDTITHHRMPLTIALSVDKMLNRQLSIGTGLQYTRLYSETQEGNTYSWVQKVQRLQYLGIPLRLSWHPLRTNRWHLYGTAQAMLELPLHSTLQSNTIVGGQQIKAEEFRLSPSVQWSIGTGVGLEYRLTPVIGIYAEPSLQYFFKTGDALDSYRTAHPAAFSVPFGIRLHW
ncbi:MAG: sigma-70 family RNA polymerase sigma factor [Prevotella sp.]|nr:sigma-70 family RNA polymerase sigma factor [Prevotella sp.]